MAIDLEQLFFESGALKEGHFLLASGRHSDKYLEKFDLLRNPVATSQVLEPLAALLADWDIAVIVGPTTGGILLAFELARQLGLSAAYAERKGEGTPGAKSNEARSSRQAARSSSSMTFSRPAAPSLKRSMHLESI